MIKTLKELEMLGDLNPTRKRIPEIGFPKEVERQLVKLEKIKYECLGRVIDSEFEDTQQDWDYHLPMSDKEETLFLNLINIWLGELYWKLEKHLVERRDTYTKFHKKRC